MSFSRVGAAAALAILVATAADAQNMMRSPSINIESRIVTPAPVAPRVDPGIATHSVTVTPVIRAPTPALVGRAVTRPISPTLHTSPNLYPGCQAAERDGDGDCIDVQASNGNGSSAKGKGKGKSDGPRRGPVQAVVNLQTITGELVAEIDGLTDEQADAAARRHGLRRIESRTFPLINATIGRFRIADGRSFAAASRDFATETGVRSIQPNYRYLLQDQKTAAVEGDPAQYVLAKMRLPEAHTLAHGTGIRVAVIDSAIDLKHRELANSVVDSFDAVGSNEGPHVHGTGIAGAIAAHARLMGSAPAAQLIAIRAFTSASNGAQSNSYIILKSLDYAVQKGARIVNMSFAGPKDGLIERGIDAVAARGILMVAAAGNAGPKSPPLYPGANANVIAVSATDAQDHLLPASNRGSYVALAAPGSEVFLPAPDDKYQMTSGTSFSAAYVSGAAALMLERNPALKPDEVRGALLRTARDLGSPGRDDLFGAGEADAYAAVEAVITPPAAPLANSSAPTRALSQEKAAEPREIPPVRGLEPQVSTVASEKPAIGEPPAR